MHTGRMPCRRRTAVSPAVSSTPRFPLYAYPPSGSAPIGMRWSSLGLASDSRSSSRFCSVLRRMSQPMARSARPSRFHPAAV